MSSLSFQAMYGKYSGDKSYNLWHKTRPHWLLLQQVLRKEVDILSIRILFTFDGFHDPVQRAQPEGCGLFMMT